MSIRAGNSSLQPPSPWPEATRGGFRALSCRKPQSQAFRILLWLGALASLALLGSYISYIRGNSGNHTGLDPWLLSFVFAPTALCGIVALCRRRFVRSALLACTAGLIGMSFLLYIDHYNIMVEHDRWCHRGGPRAGAVTGAESPLH